MTLCRGALLVLFLSAILNVGFAARKKPSCRHIAKFLRFFHVADANHDGVIEVADYQLIADKILTIEGCNSYTKEQFKEDIVPKAYAAFPNKTMTRKEFMDNAENYINDPKFKEQVAALADLKFDIFNCQRNGSDNAITEDEFAGEHYALSVNNTVKNKHMKEMDSNGDGTISEQEFMDSSLVREVFKVLDTNHDGKLTREEYANGMVQFMIAEGDDSPFDIYFGWL